MIRLQAVQLSQGVAFYKKYTVIITNITLLLFEKLVTVGLVFFSEGLTSRLLGVSLYGKWLYSINTIILLSSVVLVVGAEVVVPALVRHPRLRWRILSSVFVFRFAFAFMALVVVLGYVYFFVEDQSVQLMLMLLACTLIFNEPFSVVANYYQAQTKMGIIVVIRIMTLSLRAIMVFIAFWCSSYLVVYATRAIEALFLAIALSSVIIFRGGLWDWHKRVSIVMLSRGMTLWIPLVLMLAYMRLDRFFIEGFLGFEDLAMYGVASQLLEQAVLVMGIVMQSIAPMLLYGRKVKRMRTVCLGMLLVAFLLQIMGFLWLTDIVTLIFGQHYQPAAEWAILMLPALSFLAIDSVFMQRLYRDKKYSHLLYKWLVLFIISLINHWLLLSVFQSDKIYLVYVVNAFFMMAVTIFIYSTYVYKERCIWGGG